MLNMLLLWTAQIEHECTPSAGLKWVVLETPRPEEAVVAAARVVIPSGGGGKSVIKLFAAETDEQRDQLLVSIESTVRSFNVESIVMEVPQWREDVHEWLSRCGYVDTGGHEWPEADRHMLLKHTMVLEFQVFIVHISKVNLIRNYFVCE